MGRDRVQASVMCCLQCCSTLELINQKITEQLDIIGAHKEGLFHWSVPSVVKVMAAEQSLTIDPLPVRPMGCRHLRYCCSLILPNKESRSSYQ